MMSFCYSVPYKGEDSIKPTKALMNYSHYNIEDFIADEEFKSWVLRPTHECDQFWRNWINSNPQKRTTVLKAKEVILSMKFNETTPPKEHYHSVLSNVLSEEQNDFFQKKLGKGDYHPPGNNSNRFFIYKMAASIAIFLICGALYFYFSPIFKEEKRGVTYITKKISAGHRTIELPDGSYVKLNSQSSITYPDAFSDTIRSIDLRGEAFFDINENKGKKFVVNTPYLDINVLGTSFNVRAYEDEQNVNVALATGKVTINHQGQPNKKNNETDYFLLPGEKFVLNRVTNQISKSGFNPELEYGWKDGILLFNDADLDEFTHTLERWYGVQFKVVGEKQGDWHIEGRFENESLREVLEGLSFTYNIRYTLENDFVTLYI